MKDKNCLNLIRLLAAIQVFLGHASGHLKTSLPDLLVKPFSIIQGVPVFFLISGFLIWNSLNRNSGFKQFAKKRVLRLYPELWGGVLLSVITILALYREPIHWNQFVLWVGTQSTVFQFWTPDFLRGYGCGTPNGSLWTIGVMVQAYIVIWFLHKLLHKGSKRKWILSMGLCIVFNIFIPFLSIYIPEIIGKLIRQTFIPYIWIFILGAMICENFDGWKVYLIKYWWIFLSISAVATFTGLDMGTYGTIKVFFLALAVIGFAYRFPVLNIKKDISYGFYIYHMVVINVMIEIGLTESIGFILIAFILSVVLALISYHTTGVLYRKQKERSVSG